MSLTKEDILNKMKKQNRTYWICLSIFALIMASLCYFNHRNNNVFKFRNSIIKSVFDTEKNLIENGVLIESNITDLMNKYSYEQTLYSVKPLKLKYWYTEEEIKKIIGEDSIM